VTERQSDVGTAAVEAPSASLTRDIDRFFADPARSFELFHPECSISYQVTKAQDGRINLVFDLPVGLAHSFASFLGSMHQFMRVLDPGIFFQTLF